MAAGFSQYYRDELTIDAIDKVGAIDEVDAIDEIYGDIDTEGMFVDVDSSGDRESE